MKKLLNNLFGSKYGWLALLVLLAGINYLASILHTRIDLTREKRYTLSAATLSLLNQLDDQVRIDVFLRGDFPSGFRKLSNSTEEFLQLLKDRNGPGIDYRFISPQDEIPGENGKSYEDTLIGLGALPINLTVQVKSGQENKRVYPIAILKYKDRQAMVNLYSGGKRMISAVEMNSAEALMEYQFANALDGLIHPDKPLVGYSSGNGEPLIGSQVVNGIAQYLDPSTADLEQTLRKDYQLFTLNLNSQPFIPDTFKVLIV
ncbi:MAG TPA: GldG family protein, partial [Chitinophagaceae bacterium]|nr:GldG family protein [Chitinophagaceae bacterium]